MGKSGTMQDERDEFSPSTISAKVPPLPVKIDNAKPMWGQVGKLGDAYWEWVHVAEPGASRFFESDFLELFSMSVWWLVPLIFLPAIVGISWDAYKTGRSAGVDLLIGALIGFPLWQLHEYSFHRFFFHNEVSSPLWMSLHYIFHGSHHKHPMDRYRCVFPPVVSVSTGVFWFFMLDFIFPKRLSRGVWAGLAAGYLVYDMIHYALHVYKHPPGSFLKMLKSRHNIHHYKNPEQFYGVSSEIMDLIIGT